jgi:uncharacterized protein
MLIEFSVGNYRSFKEKVTFSMVAANLVAKDKQLDENNVFTVDDDLKLLKSAAIYGANGSGKSNLAKALIFMKRFMNDSSKETQSTEKIGVEQFKLSVELENKPSFFEIVFLMNDRKYRYGFEATSESIIAEWLFHVPKARETRLFERKNDQIAVARAYKSHGLEQRTRHNALFLSVSAQFNVQIAEDILAYQRSDLNVISGLADKQYRKYTVSCLGDDQNRNEILSLIEKLDLGFREVSVVVDEITAASDWSHPIKTIHSTFDKDGNTTSKEIFDLDEQESEGTKKIFALAGPLIYILKNGATIVIDEFDASVHPLINQAIAQLFNSPETNPNNAQLIFMTHDTNLLSKKLFRRDQIWFAEKDRYGATSLYSLAEYKIRNDASFESDYIKGKYGAIPFIGDLHNLIESHG